MMKTIRASFAVTLCFVLFAANVASAQTAPFTANERSKLARGELVVRPQEERRGDLRLIGGVSWQVINLPPDAVFRAIRDTSNYQHMLPKVDSARVVGRTAGGPIVAIEHDTPVPVRYRLRTTINTSRRDVSFRLDQSGDPDLRAAWGFFNVRPYGTGRSILSYGVMADIGSGIVRSALRPTVHTWMLKVPQMVKRFAEGRGRERYLTARR